MNIADRLQLVVIGTSFRRVGFDGLVRFVLPTDGPGALARLRAVCGATELVYVATCNRVEAYLAIPSEESAIDAEGLAARAAAVFGARSDDLFVEVGTGALEHLFSVVASLESLVLGECEIAGQVRRAAERARALGLDGPHLRRVFERAAAVAKRVRSETAIGRTPVSVASLCIRRVREHIGEGAKGRAAIVGVGEVSRKVATGLAGRGLGLLFVNRTLSRAEALAAEHGGEAMSLEAFLAAPPEAIQVLVAATAAPGPVIPAAALAPALEAGGSRGGGAGRRLLVCDLAMPRNVDPALDGDPRVRCVTLADLEPVARENRRRLEGEAGAARAIVRDEVERFAHQHRLRLLASLSVEGLLARKLSHLAPGDRATLRTFATNLAERMARQPR